MKNWEKTGEFGPEGNHVKGVWECPDLFPIEYKGKNVWVLVVSMTKASEDDHCKMQYFLGDFDGEKFLCTYPSDEQDGWMKASTTMQPLHSRMRKMFC